MDHLLNTLINDVVPYYALKQRRQDLGFEGINIEVRKWQDILKRSQEYVKADIQVCQLRTDKIYILIKCLRLQPIGDGKYLVASKAEPSRSYEVDISTYTCPCLDFPLISFCKHLAAVQTLFDESVLPIAFPGSAISQDVQDSDNHSEVSSHHSDIPVADSIPAPQPAFVEPKRRVLTVLAEKLETLAARLCRPRTKESDLPTLSTFEGHLQDMLNATDTGAVLPSAQYVKPNVNGWRQTQKSMAVMPRVKTKARKAGDPAYGGGASSGSKVKRAKPMCVYFGHWCNYSYQ